MSIARPRKKHRKVAHHFRRGRWLMVLAVAGVVSGVVTQHVMAAWQNPTCDPNVNPDTCNAAAPLNVSAAAQTKNGPLTVSLNTGSNALTVTTGATGSPVALAINSAGGGFGIDVANTATSGAVRVTSTGAATAATIIQNQSGGAGLNVSVGGSAGGTAISGGSTTSTTGVGVYGLGSAAGVRGIGSGSGNGVEGTIGAAGTGSAGYFDGINSAQAITSVNGQVKLTAGLASTSTLDVTATLGGATGPSAITATGNGTGAPTIYASAANNHAVVGNTTSYNFGGLVGCYSTAINCAVLGSGAFAGYFNGPALVERTLRVNEISAGDTVQELQVQGQLSDNSFSAFVVSSAPSPYALESSGDYLWECNRAAPFVVQKLRPSTGKIVGVVALGAGFQCSDLTFDGQNIWVSSDGATTGVTRIDINTQIATSFPVGSVIKGLTFDGVTLWATGFNTNQIFQINSKTGAILATYPALAGGGPYGIVHAKGLVWWVNNNPVGGKYYLSSMKVDGTSMTQYVISAEAPQRLVFDGDALWVPSTLASAKLIRFDATNKIERLVVAMPESMRDIVFDQNFLWISASTTRNVYVVRPIDGSLVNTILVNSPSGTGTLERLYFDGHGIWTSLSTDNLLNRFIDPWTDGYANGNLFEGISLYDSASNSYTCLRSNGTGGISTVVGLCP